LLVLLAGTLATGIEEIVLDMAPNSFDDRYLNCHEEMVEKLPMINRSEFASNKLYAQVWAEAAAQPPRPQGALRQREEAIALMAYTMSSGLSKEFNTAVHEGGRSQQEYLNNFHYKVMHFLLTEALSDLKGAQTPSACFPVYKTIRGTWSTAKQGQIIRFGQFTSTFLTQQEAEGSGAVTVLRLDTCHGAMIKEFSFQTQQEEVLIPPFETFRVTLISHQSDTTFIQLSSHGAYSKYNCAWLKGDIPG
ncbi:NRT1 ribosyltransferase, partial [Sakesphorus luctuosus]|nr:NRT1 ribosyltransferase [Sakesphorus luctuosus]